MAITSIWRIGGWLGKLVVYVENPEKTKNPAFYESSELTPQQTQNLSDVIDYASNDNKTTHRDSSGILHQFVSGINCHPGTARDEMLEVKNQFGKEDGTVAYHGIQSFAPGEATPEIAHEIGVRLAQQLWGDKYQVLVATHLDKENHLHSHFVVNTVSFVDGIKYHRTEKDYYDLQKASDALCLEYGLSVIEDPKHGKSKHYGEWRAEKEGRSTWRSIIRNDVDEAIRQSMTDRQFFDNLKNKGYEVKLGKDISLRPPGKERFFRLTRNFGADYELEAIRRRILGQQRPQRVSPEPAPQRTYSRLKGSLEPARKITGFRALYFHYCYLLGFFPRGKPRSNKRLHFLLKEDLIKLDSIIQETRLLARERIDTDRQLFAYQEKAEEQIKSLATCKRQLHNKARRVDVKADPVELAEIQTQTSALSEQICALRKEIQLCKNIAQRSGVIRNTIQTVRKDQSQRKEIEHHEHIRRCSGTNRQAQFRGY